MCLRHPEEQFSPLLFGGLGLLPGKKPGHLQLEGASCLGPAEESGRAQGIGVAGKVISRSFLYLSHMGSLVGTTALSLLQEAQSSAGAGSCHCQTPVPSP